VHGRLLELELERDELVKELEAERDSRIKSEKANVELKGQVASLAERLEKQLSTIEVLI
jgi:hypothetical protein